MSHPPKDKTTMSAVEFDAFSRQSVRFLEDHAAEQGSMPVGVARKIVARRIGVSPGTLEGIRKGRTKGVREWVAERIRAAFIRELEAEIARLSHELQMARARGSDPRSDVMAKAVASLASARALIEEAAR